MSQVQVPQSPFISLVNDRPATTSLAIAESFGKRHDDVVKSIRNLCPKCPEEFTARNFAVSEYSDSTGRRLPMFTVFFDGFILLVMGYTGKKALQMKLAYIEAFNAMKEQLENQSLQKMQQLPASDSPLTPDQQCTLQAMVRALVEKGGIYANIWSRFNNHFRLGSYKQLPQSRLSEAVDYLMRLEVTPRALPGFALPAKQDKVHLPDEMPALEDLDKRRARICRELYQLQEKFGCLIDEIRLCLHPGGRLLRLPPESDNAYETLAALNRVATGGAYTARQAIYSAYQIGKGLKFV